MIQVVGRERIELLKKEAWEHPKRRARIILHSQQDTVTEMIIALHETSYLRPHKHPWGKPESYHVMEGRLLVYIFNDDGFNTIKIKLDAETPFYKLQGDTYHQPVAISEFAVYHEVYPGPFRKPDDVLYAPWANAEAA